MAQFWSLDFAQLESLFRLNIQTVIGHYIFIVKSNSTDVKNNNANLIHNNKEYYHTEQNTYGPLINAFYSYRPMYIRNKNVIEGNLLVIK